MSCLSQTNIAKFDHCHGIGCMGGPGRSRTSRGTAGPKPETHHYHQHYRQQFSPHQENRDKTERLDFQNAFQSLYLLAEPDCVCSASAQPNRRSEVTVAVHQAGRLARTRAPDSDRVLVCVAGPARRAVRVRQRPDLARARPAPPMPRGATRGGDAQARVATHAARSAEP